MMRSDRPRRPLLWEGSSKEEFKTFPTGVQKDFGVALFVVQIGGMPPSAKTMRGLGPGTLELIENHRGDAFRVIFVLRGDQIHVLHAFKKKSKSGIKTPRQDIEIARRRLAAAERRDRIEEGKKSK